MTDMKRVTISMPPALDRRILDLRRTDERFLRSSYSEIVRALLEAGMVLSKDPPPSANPLKALSQGRA
jgi:hypothetical protein